MKRIAFVTAAALMLASFASAGGMAFSFPTLTFPPATDASVAKDCLPTQSAAATCNDQE